MTKAIVWYIHAQFPALENHRHIRHYSHIPVLCAKQQLQYNMALFVYRQFASADRSALPYVGDALIFGDRTPHKQVKAWPVMGRAEGMTDARLPAAEGSWLWLYIGGIPL